ncbi:MAG TPA: DNA-3-methyladenine glycosylase, partial [Myxococcota bacterium]|nr:DNA-3-methyladenine glycosylase [Myxococcota bacterium]
MLNLVTGKEGEAEAVLIRAAEPVAGLAQIRERRGGKSGPVLLTGPGKVGAALGLPMEWSGRPLDAEIQVFARTETPPLVVGPRVGIDYASEADRAAPWRVALAGSAWGSQPKTLKALSASI